MQPPDTASGKFGFDAFISYRRADGRRAAHWLRTWLQQYRLPDDIRGQLKHEVREPPHVFLDTAYSRGVADYYENNIQPALCDSEFLLVIASPEALQPGRDGGQNWVEREIGDFLATPQRRNIIAFATRGFVKDVGAIESLPGKLLELFPRLQVISLNSLTIWRFLWWPLNWHLREAAISCIASIHQIPAELMPLLRQEEERYRRKRMAALATAAVSLLVIGTIVGSWVLLVNRQKVMALQDVLGISDLRKVDELNERADLGLWPLVPSKKMEIDHWLVEARDITARLPTHQATLASLDQRPGLTDIERGWWRANLQQLIDNLSRLKDTSDSGVACIPRLERRRAQIDTIAKLSIEDSSEVWKTTAAAISNDPRFGGVKIEPQFGLVPLEADPESGLWEFWHPQTGERPQRDTLSGRWIITPSTGLVLVLLPGGKFRMGSEVLREEGREPVIGNELPSHEVEISPFFLSKYEMTQGQWTRINNGNPSYFRAGSVIDRRTVTYVHPVENVAWDECALATWHLGLCLPTEAQWEYAERAETGSVYFTGDSPRSLNGYVNLLDSFAKRGTEIQSANPGEMWLDDGYGYHAPVGSFRANGLGLHDMVGNVSEWCWDMSGSYAVPVKAGTGERLSSPVSLRMVRGASFSMDARDARSARRFEVQPKHSSNYLGVRPARPLRFPGDKLESWAEATDSPRRLALDFFEQGKVLGEGRNYEAAAKEFMRASELAPELLEARMNRGVCMALLKRLDEAIMDFEFVLERNPKHAMARAKLAQGLAETGRSAEAIPHYRNAFDLLPNPYPELTRLLMEALVKEDRLPEALEAARAHLQKGLPDAGFSYRYGWVLRQSGKLDEAVEEFRRSIELEPSALRHAGLAAALAENGSSELARRHFEAAVALGPCEEDVHAAWMAFLKSSGDTDAEAAERARWQRESQ